MAKKVKLTEQDKKKLCEKLRKDTMNSHVAYGVKSLQIKQINNNLKK